MGPFFLPIFTTTHKGLVAQQSHSHPRTSANRQAKRQALCGQIPCSNPAGQQTPCTVKQQSASALWQLPFAHLEASEASWQDYSRFFTPGATRVGPWSQYPLCRCLCTGLVKLVGRLTHSCSFHLPFSQIPWQALCRR